jgi:hypothetical protein
MEDEDITYVPNRKGGQNLKNKEGFVFTRTKMLPLKDKNYRYWKCIFCQRFGCQVTVVSTIWTQKLVLRTGEHTHSNQLLEQTIREVELEKVKLAGQMPTVGPRTVLGDITVALETNLPGGTAFMRSKQSISKAIHWERQAIKGFPSSLPSLRTSWAFLLS